MNNGTYCGPADQKAKANTTCTCENYMCSDRDDGRLGAQCQPGQCSAMHCPVALGHDGVYCNNIGVCNQGACYFKNYNHDSKRNGGAGSSTNMCSRNDCTTNNRKDGK